MNRPFAWPRAALALLCAFAASCAEPPEGPSPQDLTTRSQGLHGVPQNGYPNYQELLMLMAINRGRSDPNNTAAGTMNTCSANYAAQKPLVLSYEGSRAARFHCSNLMLTQSGLSHNSYCTLRSDIGTTNCDGSANCACVAGTEAFNCTTLGGNGTDPWTRVSYFGYTGANGEVGAAGYGDGWSANVGWITECAGADGHRVILTGGGKDTIGLGYYNGGGCWPTYYFGDTANQNITTPALPSAVVRPQTGGATTNFTFYATYHDPAATPAPPTSIDVVIDGVCHPMTKEIGVTPNNFTYTATNVVGTGCHQYWILARDSQNVRHAWPEAGAWGVGSCSDYVATATIADCDSCAAGATKACGQGACAGTSTCQAGGFWGACNGPAPAASESCNGIDDDCDGVVPANELDKDNDGYRPCQGDCDDNDGNVHPGATEICDGKDDDCDGTKLAGETDADNDGWPLCLGDCDDSSATVHPGAVELCDGKDNDCDGNTPADEVDGDGDGYRLCQGDCDDADGAVHPGATEACNTIDDNCDRAVDEGCACTKNTTRACGSSVGACQPGTQTCRNGQLTWTACTGGVAPVTEICGNGADDDCDGATDETCPAPTDGGVPGRPDATAPGPDAAAPPGLDAANPAGPDAAAQPGDDASVVPPGPDAAAQPGDDASVVPPGPDAAAQPGDDASVVPPGPDASAQPGDDAAIQPGDDAGTTEPPDATTAVPTDGAIVATDAAATAPDATTALTDGGAVPAADAGGDPGAVQAGCSCATTASPIGAWPAILLALGLIGRRRRG